MSKILAIFLLLPINYLVAQSTSDFNTYSEYVVALLEVNYLNNWLIKNEEKKLSRTFKINTKYFEVFTLNDDGSKELEKVFFVDIEDINFIKDERGEKFIEIIANKIEYIPHNPDGSLNQKNIDLRKITGANIFIDLKDNCSVDKGKLIACELNYLANLAKNDLDQCKTRLSFDDMYYILYQDNKERKRILKARGFIADENISIGDIDMAEYGKGKNCARKVGDGRISYPEAILFYDGEKNDAPNGIMYFVYDKINFELLKKELEENKDFRYVGEQSNGQIKGDVYLDVYGTNDLAMLSTESYNGITFWQLRLLKN